MQRSIPFDPIAALTPETWLGRGAFSAALRRAGYKISPATLASKAARRDGPPYRRNLDKTVEYQWEPGLLWAKSQVTHHNPAVTETLSVEAAA